MKKDLIIGIGVGIPVLIVMVIIGGGGHAPPIDFEDESSQDCSGIARCITGIVTRIIDGDTIKVDSQSIRFALASAPELDEFGGDTAREFISDLCPAGSTVLVDEDDGQTGGSYGRIIGVVYCNGVNLNSELLDSSLGYLTSGFCDASEFSSDLWTQKHGCTSSIEPEASAPLNIQSNCNPSYPDFCIPTSLPDLDCGDISQKRFTVLPPDPHRFDGDKDGIGCES
ncbi:MAG: thermonuclease family protein [Crenarchaeota archaeon]|nr:thermonuclease family protein [Thermoproteota archaeon]